MTKMQSIDYTSSVSKAVREMTKMQSIDYTSSVSKAVLKYSSIDFNNFNSVVKQSLNNLSKLDIANIKQTTISSIKDISSKDKLIQLNGIINFSVLEIENSLKEYKEGQTEILAEVTVGKNIQYTKEEIEAIFDKKLETANKNNSGLKGFILGIAISYGEDLAKMFINEVLLPLISILLISIGNSWENHVDIINTIQHSLPSNLCIVGYLHAKHTIKSEAFTKYESIDLIGLTRVESFLRTSPNKQSTPISIQKVPLNTVITIVRNDEGFIERKKNWIKIEVLIDDNIIEGWIEKSKVIRFNRIK